MRKRTVFESDTKIPKITVDVTELQIMLSVGRNTAMQIGKDAGAVLHVGGRVLYNIEKIKKYIDMLTEKEQGV